MQPRTTYRRLNTAKQQAEALNCSLRHLAKLKARRVIPYVKLGKSLRFDPEAVQRAIEKLSVREIG
jgi:excisionase family DNA binding protein